MRKKRLLALLLAMALLLSACGTMTPSISDAMQQRQEELSAEDTPAEEPETATEEEPEAVPEEEPAEEAETETEAEEIPAAEPEEEPAAEPEERDLTLGRENLIPFDEMEYVRPELAPLEEQIAITLELAADGSNSDAVIDSLLECDALYYTYYTMYALAEIRYYQDMTSEYWSEEYTVCDEGSVELEILFEDMYVALAESPCAQAVEDDYYGEGFIEYYTGDFIGYSDETYAELIRRENEVMAEFREIQANPTVRYNGEEVSYYEVMSDPDLSYLSLLMIEDAYYDKYTPIYGELFIELIRIRNELAVYCGYENYEEYAYAEVYARTYTPEEIEPFLADIRTHITPLYEELSYAGAWSSYGDYEIDEAGLEERLGLVAAEMGGDIEAAWELLKTYELYDIRQSPNKVEMSFQTYLEDYEAPFAFIKTYGDYSDLLTFYHEFGHCVDSYVNYNDTWDLDLAETFSQGMEYLALCALQDDLSEAEWQDLVTMKLLDTLDTYAQQGSFADFEHQIYSLSDSELTVDRINEISLQTSKDYGYYVPGYEDYFERSWIDIIHFFEQPCYVISYCMSNDAAFQIYQRELEERGAGLDLYLQILPREYEDFFETLEKQGGMESPLAEGRLESTARIIGEFFGV